HDVHAAALGAFRLSPGVSRFDFEEGAATGAAAVDVHTSIIPGLDGTASVGAWTFGRAPPTMFKLWLPSSKSRN
ncbi:MAG TPA: hypothetical protein PLV92_00735, partial [Pirellulaceae bacterium]|nr:hypothetical protein [Pirellulaceae bacterium]